MITQNGIHARSDKPNTHASINLPVPCVPCADRQAVCRPPRYPRTLLLVATCPLACASMSPADKPARWNVNAQRPNGRNIYI